MIVQYNLSRTICPVLNCCGTAVTSGSASMCSGGLWIAGAETESERSRSTVSEKTHIDFNGNLLTPPPFWSGSIAVPQLVKIGGKGANVSMHTEGQNGRRKSIV
ncbi:hypothetical protein R3I94_017842 [Phoxinus phoxinus]